MSSIPSARERALVAALSALAALRVLVLATAFPFFANVDEHRHVDVALKYARGYAPAPGRDAYEPEMGSYVAIYGSPEYHWDDSNARAVPAPAWRQPPREMLSRVERQQEFFSGRPNLEAYQPPVYYALAGLWLRAGAALGLEGGALLYWLRGLNALVLGVLVWVAYALLRGLYPRDALVRLGVPVLLAVFPLDVFYYVTRDALSPLVAGTAFLLWLHLARRPESGRGLHVAAGLATGAALLTKYTNAALLPVAALCSARGLLRGPRARWLLAWTLALVPLALWLLRNQLVFGDPTGTSLKVARLGWEHRALADVWPHPLLSASGLARFVGELVPAFWRGELVWHRKPLVSSGADLVYTASTLGFLALAAVGLARRSAARDARFQEGVALTSVLAAAAILMVLSLAFVFGERTVPSVRQPFFTQGRLVSGVLVPFLLLYVRGIQIAAARLPERVRDAAAWGVLAAVVAVAVGSELALTRPVFASAYNAYHLP